MRFLVDNQLPAALARFLATQGLDCQHVIDLGLAEAKDRQVWQFATAQKMVIISKDEDFFLMANRPESQVQLVWVRLGNCRNQALIDAMGPRGLAFSRALRPETRWSRYANLSRHERLPANPRMPHLQVATPPKERRTCSPNVRYSRFAR